MMIKGCRGRDRMVVGFSTICASVPITTIQNKNKPHGLPWKSKLDNNCNGENLNNHHKNQEWKCN
jgi:hypothetical protein